MRLYWEIAKRGFRRHATYRGATVAGIFTNTVFGFLLGYVRLALFEHRPTIEGYTAQDIITYTFVLQGLLLVVQIWGFTSIADTIVTGDVVVDLYRPLDYQGYWLAQDVGRAAYHVLGRGIPPFAIGVLFFPLALCPLEMVVPFVVSVALAVVVSFGLRFLVNLTAFWLLNIRGIMSLSTMLWTVLGGFVVPVHFFPPVARDIANILPFRAMAQIPVDVWLGKLRGLDLVATLGFQALWGLALLAAGRVVLAAATRKVVVQGG